jgi:hypothetical protein
MILLAISRLNCLPSIFNSIYSQKRFNDEADVNGRRLYRVANLFALGVV